ncbi:MAG: hypothetical protein COB36_11675 [Alphaproteobacteria bacterium]|nr:MAG: hypothetical protein COB36_11675 [Alphaproteobacteria bacterium]
MGISAPIDHIAQGNAYGEAHLKGRDNYNYREGQISENEKACDAKHKADNKRHDDKNAARQEAIDKAIDLAAQKKWYEIF